MTKNMTNCKRKLISADSMVDTGIASRGKYTLLKMAEFAVNVAEILLMQAAKYPHTAVPAR